MFILCSMPFSTIKASLANETEIYSLTARLCLPNVSKQTLYFGSLVILCMHKNDKITLKNVPTKAMNCHATPAQ